MKCIVACGDVENKKTLNKFAGCEEGGLKWAAAFHCADMRKPVKNQSKTYTKALK